MSTNSQNPPKNTNTQSISSHHNQSNTQNDYLQNSPSNNSQQNQVNNQQQLLLSKTQQKAQSKYPQPSLSSFQQSINNRCPYNPYIKTQHGRINQDLEDLNNLQDEIQRLKAIKTQYKSQKESIQKLGQVVQKLKSTSLFQQIDQNQQLKKSNSKSQLSQKRQNPVQKNINNNRDQNVSTTNNKNTLENQNYYSQNQSEEKKRTNKVSFSPGGNQIVGEFLNRHSSQKSISRHNLLASLKKHQLNMDNSPQYKQLSNTSQNFYREKQKHYPFNITQRVEPYFTPVADQIVRNHVTNKHSIISNFVDELKLQLQQNQMILQQEKKSHRQTKQKLQNCLEQLRLVHLRLEQNKNTESLQRECQRLKSQLQVQISQRLLAEQKMNENQLVQLENNSYKSRIYEQFDRQLDLMDQIYFNLETTLKL